MRSIDIYNHGEVDEDEKMVAEIEEMNTAAKTGDNSTIDAIRQVFQQKLNEYPDAVENALKTIKKKQKEPVKSEKKEDERFMKDRMYAAIRNLFRHDEEETEKVDDSIYEGIQKLFENDEVQIQGVDEDVKEEIVKKVNDKVEEIKTGKKQEDTEDNMYEGVAALFEEVEKEQSEEFLANKNEKSKKLSEDELYSDDFHSFDSSNEEQSSESDEEHAEHKHIDNGLAKKLFDISYPYNFGMPAFNNNLLNMFYPFYNFNKPKESSEEEEHEDIQQEFKEEIEKDIKEITQIPEPQLQGAEKKCQTLHKEMLKNFFKKMIIGNQM